MAQVAEVETDPDLILGPEWRSVTKTKPRTPGWRAVRTADMEHLEKGYYTDAYWEGGCWYTFGLFAGLLRIRKEVRDVQFWRPHTPAEKRAIKKEVEKENNKPAQVPRYKGSRR